MCLAGGQGRLREVDGSAEQRGRVQRGEGVGRLRDARPTAGACRAAREGDGEPQDSRL